MDDEQTPDNGREALWVFFVVLIVGLVLIGAANRVLDLGPSVGNILFVALPLFAASAAAARWQHHD